MIEFFPGGVVPPGYKIDFFLSEVAKLGPRDEIFLAKAIAGLSPGKLRDLATRILPTSKDERLLRLFFKNPGVHRKMDIDALSDYFQIIRLMEHRGDIARDLFEDMAASLVAGYSSQYGESFLCRLSFSVAVATKGRSSLERFQSPEFDVALSRHLSRYEVEKQNSSQSMRSWDALKCIELPATFEVYLRAMQAAKSDSAVQLVADLVMTDKLSESYIDVARRVLGDDLLVQVANNSKQNFSGIRSIANLVPVFGESMFHHHEFLDELQDQLDSGEIPEYLTRFRSMDFDDVRFPILAHFLVKNLDLATIFKPDKSDMGFAADLAGLASRKGEGVTALIANLNATASTFGSAPEDPMTDMLNKALQVSKSRNQTVSRIQAYSHLLNVVSKVGLEILYELAPAVKSGFVMDVLEKRPIKMPKKEVMRLFPQTKGAILENDLGL